MVDILPTATMTVRIMMNITHHHVSHSGSMLSWANTVAAMAPAAMARSIAGMVRFVVNIPLISSTVALLLCNLRFCFKAHPAATAYLVANATTRLQITTP